MSSNDELACIYSAAILADDDVPITAEKITTLLNAANVSVENIWPNLFARALQGVNVRELIANSLLSGAGGAGSTGTAPAAATAAAEETKKEEKKPETDDESSDDDMGFGLFD